MKTLLLLLSLSLTMNAFAEESAYLFVTFKGEKTPLTEQIYFGLSKDGRNWEGLVMAKGFTLGHIEEAVIGVGT